jgi:hypothetical protein
MAPANHIESPATMQPLVRSAYKLVPPFYAISAILITKQEPPGKTRPARSFRLPLNRTFVENRHKS